MPVVESIDEVDEAETAPVEICLRDLVRGRAYKPSARA
jgi:hypothetical protein